MSSIKALLGFEEYNTDVESLIKEGATKSVDVTGIPLDSPLGVSIIHWANTNYTRCKDEDWCIAYGPCIDGVWYQIAAVYHAEDSTFSFHVENEKTGTDR